MAGALSDEPTVTFDSKFRQVDGLPIQPKPVQRPHPPIWFGANAPQAIVCAVRLGDAFLGAGSSTTASFVEAVKTVRLELETQGNDPAGFTIVKRPGIEAVPVSGTPDDVVRGVREVIDAGAEMVTEPRWPARRGES